MNMQMMMKQAKKLQEEMAKKKKELAKKEFVIEKQGVTIIIMGNKIIKSIDINEALVDPDDKEMLEDLMLLAMNDAIATVEEAEDDLQPKQQSMPF